MAKEDEKEKGIRSSGDGARSAPTPTHHATCFGQGKLIRKGSVMTVAYTWGRALVENPKDSQILDIPNSFSHHGLFAQAMYRKEYRYKREMAKFDPNVMKNRLWYYLVRHWSCYKPTFPSDNPDLHYNSKKVMDRHEVFLDHCYDKHAPQVRMRQRKFFKFTSNLLRRHRHKLNSVLNESSSIITFGGAVRRRQLDVELFKKKLSRYGLYPTILIDYAKFKVPGVKRSKYQQVLRGVKLNLSPCDHTVILPMFKSNGRRRSRVTGNYDETKPIYVP